MACKLYYKHGQGSCLIGTFRNRQKAEEFWKAIYPSLVMKISSYIEPIYVETGKGKGK